MKVIYHAKVFRNSHDYRACEWLRAENGFEILKEDLYEIRTEKEGLFVYNEEWWKKYEELHAQQKEIQALLAEHQRSLVPFK